MRLMNHILKPFLLKFWVAYFDDILVYIISLDEHLQQLSLLFNTLREHQLCVNLSKSEFAASEVHFLGFVIFVKGLKADLRKIQAIQKWPTPRNVFEVWSFHGLANFYRIFICRFNILMAHLTNCLKKKQFVQGLSQKNSFDTMKATLCSALVLALLDFQKPFQVEIDASTVGIRAILVQAGRPLEFLSEKLSPAR